MSTVGVVFHHSGKHRWFLGPWYWFYASWDWGRFVKGERTGLDRWFPGLSAKAIQDITATQKSKMHGPMVSELHFKFSSSQGQLILYHSERIGYNSHYYCRLVHAAFHTASECSGIHITSLLFWRRNRDIRGYMLYHLPRTQVHWICSAGSWRQQKHINSSILESDWNYSEYYYHQAAVLTSVSFDYF